MKVVEHSDAAAFLGATEGYRAGDPVRTNLVGSIAEGVVEGRRYDSEHWFTVHDRRDVVGAAVRTAPFSLVLGPMQRQAAEVLGDHLRERRQPMPGIKGPGEAVHVVAQRLGHPLRVTMRDVLRVLDALQEPVAPAGEPHAATWADATVVRAWQEAFLVEAGLPVHEADDESIRLMLERMWLWSIDGRPVAMAGHAPLVRSAGTIVGRIGPVYTVPSARRQGVGAALTAVVARVLQEAGATVMLYADADNATSNGVYERLGFRAVDEHVEADLL